MSQIQQINDYLKPNAMNARKVIIITSLTILVPLLLMKGCQSFARTMYNSMDCNQFNIDHIELRTGIDVPQIKRNYCELTDTSRTVSFQILKTGEDKRVYAEKYFRWSKESVFVQEGSNSDTRWSAQLDTVTSELVFKLHYK